ncbi:MAG: HD domain-containing protein [Kiritimatiellaeota bacterium]|nr:HD domain-containing protein [Kiritimatiellota bacterium]
MDTVAIVEWARKAMAGKRGDEMERGYRYWHGVRTGNLAVWLGTTLGLDSATLERLYVAGVLHDVGKSDGQGKEPHGPKGGRIVRAQLKRWLNATERGSVAAMVEHHYDRPRSKWYAGKPTPRWPTDILVLQDADVLDHYGAMRFASALYWARADGVPPSDFFRAYWAHPDERALRAESMRSLNFPASRVELRRRFAETRRLMRQA